MEAAVQEEEARPETPQESIQQYNTGQKNKVAWQSEI